MIQEQKATLKALVLMGGGMPKAYWYDCGPLAPALEPGTMVEVPLKSRVVPGVVVETGFPALDFAVKPILRRAGESTAVPKLWLEMLQWISKYYFTPLPVVLQACLPKAATRFLFHPPKRKLRPPRPRPVDDHESRWNEFEPTPDQKTAIDAVCADIEPFASRTFLLHGVTGSGKTLVYLHLARRVLAAGRKVLVLLPEIALTPQTIARFESFLGRPVLAFHSGLSEPQRRELWGRIFAGQAEIVIGARSAALAPLPDLGLLIVDEEHDGSYKQNDPAPRYHARDLALFRGRQENCPVVLGSATPSLETYHAARAGKYVLLSLRERPGAAAMPTVEIVDMKEQLALQGGQPLSFPLRDAVQEALDDGEQAILLLNRRGYAPRRVCAACGETRMCPRCAVALVFHRAEGALLCHYCGHSEAEGAPCTACGSRETLDVGRGIEKVEEHLREIFPDANVERLDRDNTARLGETERILSRFRAGEIRILLGTQMVAKGHDFPKVTVVGVLDADAGLELADFRAEERAFQLITQVAGRAGRSGAAGRVFLQTFRPESGLLGCALTHDYEGFFQSEIARRQALGYPPFRRVLLCEMFGPDEDEVAENMRGFAASVKELAPAAHAEVLGPAFAALKKIRNAYRIHLLIKGDYPNQLQWLGEQALERFRPKHPNKIKLRLDRDPNSLL